MRETWTTSDGLKLVIRKALDHAKATIPRIGWVRGDAVAKSETLEELNEVRKENEKLKEALGNWEIPLPPLPDIESSLEITLLNKNLANKNVIIKTTWSAVFPFVYNNIVHDFYNGDDFLDTKKSCSAIGSAIAQEISKFSFEKNFEISNNTLKKLISYYTEALFMYSDGPEPFTEFGKKFARRLHCVSNSFSQFKVISGNIDEVPF